MGLLIRVLTLIGEVAQLVGDFLSIKFMEDIWPIMRKLFLHCEKKSHGQGLLSSASLQVVVTPRNQANEGHHAGSGGSKSFTTMEGKLLEALVRSLDHVCQVDECYQFLVPMVDDIAQTCLYLLQHPHAMDEKEDRIVKLYQNLVRFDHDAVWVAAMEAAGYDISQRPLLMPGAGKCSATMQPVVVLRKKRATAILNFISSELQEGVWCSLSADDAALLSERV